MNIGLFAWVIFVALDLPPTLANLAGYLPFAAMLILGAAYWLAKDRQLVTGQSVLPGIAVFHTSGGRSCSHSASASC